jgi:hypothetical protein
MSNSTTLYSFKLKGYTAINIISFIAVLFAFILFIIFSVISNKSFIPFAVIFFLLTIISGPYVYWIRNFYSVEYFNDDKLLLKSIINFLPNNYSVDLKQISVISREKPIKAQAILFKDAQEKVLGKFNHLTMGEEEFLKLMELIKERNEHIQFEYYE